MAIIKVGSLEKDRYGVRLKFPNRSCTTCKKYPCFPEIRKCSSNFAAYGCVYFEEYRKNRSGEVGS